MSEKGYRDVLSRAISDREFAKKLAVDMDGAVGEVGADLTSREVSRLKNVVQYEKGPSSSEMALNITYRSGAM